MDRPASRGTAQWRTVLLYSPPILLIAVASIQIGLALATDLSPWKGGGFGMFSTNLSRELVVLGVFERAGDVEREVGAADQIESIEATDSDSEGPRITRSIPLHGNVRSQAALFPSEENLNWALRHARQQALARFDEPLVGLRLRVWEVRFEPAGPRFARRLVVQRRVGSSAGERTR